MFHAVIWNYENRNMKHMNIHSKSSYHSPFEMKGRSSSGTAKVTVSPMAAKFRIINQCSIAWP